MNEACVNEEDNFDILAWWKLNASRFNLLAQLVRDVLVVLVSTITSESTFSTKGCVLDTFKSSLSPKVVEALICSQNWLRPNKFNFNEWFEELEQCEKLKQGKFPIALFLLFFFSIVTLFCD